MEKAKSHSEKIDRRDFICKSALICGLMNIPLVSNSFANDDNQEKVKSDVKPIELTTYCGLYCGACDIYQKRISISGNELKRVLEAYDFASWASQMPGLEGYETFDKVLTNIITFFGQCPGCQKGGGNPECQIRICSKEKGYQTCAECDSFPCEKVQVIIDGYPLAKDNILEIRKVGLEKWAQKQQEEVDNGFRYSTVLAKKKEADVK
jgi:hypothetical protein